jgi:hypothetical protein
MGLKNIAYLDEHGPTPSAELPSRVTPRDRESGVRKFTLGSVNSASANRGGSTTPVYYLERHEETCVLRAFLNANLGLVENKSRNALHRLINNHGTRWLEAAREVTGDYYTDETVLGATASSYTEDRECDFCGETIKGKYPVHLRDCPET